MTIPRLLCCLMMLAITGSIETVAQKRQVTIRIGQDETTLLDGFENNLTLERKSFKIQVLLENIDGIYVFASFSDSICCRISELDTIAGFYDLPFPKRTMKEAEYNRDKELLVNDDNSCAYWFYAKGKSWNGFNKKIVLLDTNKVVAVKTVKQLFYVPIRKEIKIKDVKQPLYLLFVAIDESDAAGNPTKELMRRKVKIDWIDEK